MPDSISPTIVPVVPGSDLHYDEDYNELIDTTETTETKEDKENTTPKEIDKDDTNKDAKDENEDESEALPKGPFNRPSIKEIKAIYPDFFEKFPDIKEAIFREAAFAQ